jgi:hypothetical protein
MVGQCACKQKAAYNVKFSAQVKTLRGEWVHSHAENPLPYQVTQPLFWRADHTMLSACTVQSGGRRHLQPCRRSSSA